MRGLKYESFKHVNKNYLWILSKNVFLCQEMSGSEYDYLVGENYQKKY